MIFVTVGSQKFPFNRLLKKVDEMVQNHTIAELVYMQTGVSDYVPACCQYQNFCNQTEFAEKMETCSIVITHGGTGTIIDAVRRGKKTIVVPRFARYGEHVDDHQIQLVSRFHEMNLVHACFDVEKLPEAVQIVRDHTYDTFPSNTEVFITSVDECIRTL